MANTLNLGNGNWATKKDSLLAYNSENGNFKPLPFSFERASSATVVNKDGLIETVGSGEPRIDFKDNSKGALLLENTATNLITYSEDFTKSNWMKVRSFISASEIISPNGTLNAITFNSNTSTSADSFYVSQDISVSSGEDYTNSIFIKKGSSDFAYIQIIQRTSEPLGRATVVFQFSTETLGSILTTGIEPNNLSAKVEKYPNGWYRLSLFGTISGATTINRFAVGVCQSLTETSYIATTNDSVYIWGAQVEQGSYPTSYIPTQGSSVTRVAESCNNGGNEQVINSTEGVLYVETKGFIDLLTQSNYIQLSKSGEASFNNSLVLQHRDNGSLRVYVNGSATPDIHFNINIDFTENHKIAVLYKLNGYKLFIDGVAQNLYGTPTQTVFSGLDNLSFDLRGALSWNASIKDVKLYNTALTDAELQALTTI